VRGGGDDVGVDEGARRLARGDEAGDVRHIDEHEGAHLVRVRVRVRVRARARVRVRARARVRTRVGLGLGLLGLGLGLGLTCRRAPRRRSCARARSPT